MLLIALGAILLFISPRDGQGGLFTIPLWFIGILAMIVCLVGSFSKSAVLLARIMVWTCAGVALLLILVSAFLLG